MDHQNNRYPFLWVSVIFLIYGISILCTLIIVLLYRLSVAKTVVCRQAHSGNDKAKAAEGQRSKLIGAPSRYQFRAPQPSIAENFCFCWLWSSCFIELCFIPPPRTARHLPLGKGGINHFSYRSERSKSRRRRVSPHSVN